MKRDLDREPLTDEERDALDHLRERDRQELERARRRRGIPPSVEPGVDTPPRGKSEPQG